MCTEAGLLHLKSPFKGSLTGNAFNLPVKYLHFFNLKSTSHEF